MAASGQSQIGVHVAARGARGAQDTGLGRPIAIVNGCNVMSRRVVAVSVTRDGS